MNYIEEAAFVDGTFFLTKNQIRHNGTRYCIDVEMFYESNVHAIFSS